MLQRPLALDPQGCGRKRRTPFRLWASRRLRVAARLLRRPCALEPMQTRHAHHKASQHDAELRPAWLVPLHQGSRRCLCYDRRWERAAHLEMTTDSDSERPTSRSVHQRGRLPASSCHSRRLKRKSRQAPAPPTACRGAFPWLSCDPQTEVQSYTVCSRFDRCDQSQESDSP